MCYRDSEESAPAEYPPEQPEADTLDDDGTAYGAEEAELQAALEKELADTEAAATKTSTNGEDHEMAGAEEPAAKVKDEDEVSEAGSEDLEADSSGSDDDEEDDEGGDGEGDEDMEMAEGAAETTTNGEQKPIPQQVQPQVMVH